MRSISVQADPALEQVIKEWVVHLLVAMPVLPNQGIIFDSPQPGGRRDPRQPPQARDLGGQFPGRAERPGHGPLPEPDRGRGHHQPPPQRRQEQL